MPKNFSRSLALCGSFLILALIVGCSAQTSAAPTAAVAVVTTPTTAAPATVQSSPTSAATATSVATSTTAATRAATTASTSASPGTPIAVATMVPPGGTPVNGTGNAANVYATSIRVNPAVPASGPDYPTFYVTFNNTSGKSQNLRWYVKIWSPDNANQSFGETTQQINDIPAGVSEIAAAANWRTNPLNCQPFTARAYWLSTDVNFGNPNEFKKSDSSATVLSFQVCPATPKP